MEGFPIEAEDWLGRYRSWGLIAPSIEAQTHVLMRFSVQLLATPEVAAASFAFYGYGCNSVGQGRNSHRP